MVIRNGVHRVVRASRELGNDRMDTTRRAVPRRGARGPQAPARDPRAQRVGTRDRSGLRGRDRRPFTSSATSSASSAASCSTPRGSRRPAVGRARSRSADESSAITPDRWWGTRDRSWGVRPVGEPEPPGIRATTPVIGGLWNYAPMQFRDFSIMYIVPGVGHDGERALEEAVRIPALGVPASPSCSAGPSTTSSSCRARGA